MEIEKLADAGTYFNTSKVRLEAGRRGFGAPLSGAERR